MGIQIAGIIGMTFLISITLGVLFGVAMVSQFYPRVWRILWFNLKQAPDKPWVRKTK